MTGINQRSPWKKLVLVLVLSLSLGACSNSVATLHYTPSNPVQMATSPSIERVTATDQRKEAPHRLATIMGGFGYPLKTLDTAKPVKDEVVEAFTGGLRMRGLLGQDGPYRLMLIVRKFDADMIMGRTARIDITIIVTDRSDDTIFTDSVVDSQSDMKFFQTGLFADIGDMQALSQTVLDRTVDRTLDNPAFRLLEGRQERHHGAALVSSALA